MGSYNEEVTCSAVLPREAAVRFRDWLIEQLGGRSQ